jgi:outer membrane protein
MAKKWKVFWIIPAIMLCAGQLYADELLSIKAGYQLLSPEGTIGGTIGKADIGDDLKLDDSEDFSGEIALSWGNSRLSLNYLPLDFSGTGSLFDPITLNGETFSGDVKSNLTIDLYDIGYTYYLLNFDDLPTRFQFGLEAAVKVADADFALKESSSGQSESESVLAPIPTIGARARIALADYLGVAGRVGYMEFSGNHFLDAEAQVEFSPIPMVGIYAGYRYFDLTIDEDELYVDAKITGPFAGVMVRF